MGGTIDYPSKINLGDQIAMHDPMQAYSTLGAYSGVTPFGLPYWALQTPGIHPSLANPLAQTMGLSPAYSGYGTHPAQLGITGGWQNPFWQNPLIAQAIQNPLLYPGLQNPLLQNPLLQNPFLQHQLLQNPMLQNPFVNPIQAQLQAHAQQLALQAYAAQAGGISPYGVGSPYGQPGSQFTQPGLPSSGISPLAPQTWVGQGAGIGYGQGQSIQPHAFAQFAGRGFQAPGISPWAGF
jgi:hypothetical protein